MLKYILNFTENISNITFSKQEAELQATTENTASLIIIIIIYYEIYVL